MESGPAPAHPLTEPGRTTVQLLVASSAVIALVQLVAATSVDVYHGERAGWWVAIQGATVAFAAAFAGAAASANGAWWRRSQQKSSSTTPGSLGTGIAASSVAGAVFSMLCWASSSLGDAAYPMVVAVFVAALLGGVVGAVRVGGAVLGGLVSTFAATLVNLIGQGLIRAFTSSTTESGTPLGISAVNWGVSSIVGSVVGVWWLSRRRQRSWWSHWLIIGLFPVVLVGIGDFAELLAWLIVDDPEKGEALRQALPGHTVQLLVMAVIGGIAAAIAGRVLRAHPEWLVRKPPADVPGAGTAAEQEALLAMAERAAQTRAVELAREAELARETHEDDDDNTPSDLTAEQLALIELADRAVQARTAELSGQTPRPTPPPAPPAAAPPTAAAPTVAAPADAAPAAPEASAPSPEPVPAASPEFEPEPIRTVGLAERLKRAQQADLAREEAERSPAEPVPADAPTQPIPSVDDVTQPVPVAQPAPPAPQAPQSPPRPEAETMQLPQLPPEQAAVDPNQPTVPIPTQGGGAPIARSDRPSAPSRNGNGAVRTALIPTQPQRED